MRVALVADTFSVEKGTGIARYSQELLAGLTRKGLGVEPIAPEPPNLPFGLAINHAVKMPCLVRSKTGRFDLIHATSPITALAFPVARKPRVVTYLDLISLLSDNASMPLSARLFAPFFLRIGRYADGIIAASSQTKDEMIAHLGIPAGKITVVGLGVGEMFETRRRDKGGTFVIGYVGSLNRRKALPCLFRAMRILMDSHPEIPTIVVICGRKDLEYTRLVQTSVELGLTQIIQFRGSVPDEELVDTYNSFDVFVLPSEREGFGLPILEAQRCGVPVIIRENAHIPAEISKCCLKATSEEDMANKIYELLKSTDLRQSVIEQGLEHSYQFTWEKTVEQTITVYKEALASR